MTTKLPSTLEALLVALFRNNPPTGTPIPDPDPYAVTQSKNVAVIGGLVVWYDADGEQVVLDASGISSPPPQWNVITGSSPYIAPSVRRLWLLVDPNTIEGVQLPADVQEGDEVVIRLTGAVDSGPGVSSADDTIEFQTGDSTFASFATLSLNYQLVRYKYTANCGYSGHSKAYLLW